MDPRQLGFTPQRPVGWLAPLLLLSTGLALTPDMAEGSVHMISSKLAPSATHCWPRWSSLGSRWTARRCLAGSSC